MYVEVRDKNHLKFLYMLLLLSKDRKKEEMSKEEKEKYYDTIKSVKKAIRSYNKEEDKKDKVTIIKEDENLVVEKITMSTHSKRDTIKRFFNKYYRDVDLNIVPFEYSFTLASTDKYILVNKNIIYHYILYSF